MTLIAGVLVLLMLVGIGVNRALFGAGGLPQVSYSGKVGVPGQVLLPSMRSKPVVGWSVDIAALLPGAGELLIDYVGYIGDKGYFTVEGVGIASLGQGPRTWLIGVDLASGAMAFAPVEIGVGRTNCFLNGPHRVLCLTTVRDSPDREADPHDVFVVDTDTGNVLVHGPTELNPFKRADPYFEVVQAGDYAIASREDVGTYGIGDDGKPSWFIEGDGWVLAGGEDRRFSGDPSTNLATMDTKGGPTKVFSVAGGVVVATVSKGTVDLYPGGFAVSRSMYPLRVEFYDARGVQVGEYAPPDYRMGLSGGNGQLPWVTYNFGAKNEAILVLDNQGSPMAVVQASGTSSAGRILGGYLYVGPRFGVGDPDEVWNKFDLRTGKRVSSCSGIPLARSTYLGSDGNVVLGSFRTPGDQSPIIAVDTDTCAVLWRSDDPMWAVGGTLVQAQRRVGKIASLVPPSR